MEVEMDMSVIKYCLVVYFFSDIDYNVSLIDMLKHAVCFCVTDWSKQVRAICS